MRRAATAACTVAALLSACGADGGEKPDPETIVRAAQITEARGGVHIVYEGTMKSDQIPDDISFRSEGNEDRRARAAEYDVDLSEFAALDDSLGAADDLRARSIKRGAVQWVRLPALDELVTSLGFPDESWIEMDLRQQRESSSEVGAAIAQMNEQDPGQVLDYVHVAEATERVGEETVAGMPVTHYRGKVVLAEVVRELPADERPATRAGVERVRRATGEDELPIDVWIDEDALIRRIRLHYDFERNPETGAEFQLQLEVTADLSGFGVRVDPRVPRGAEVVKVTELVEAAE